MTKLCKDCKYLTSYGYCKHPSQPPSKVDGQPRGFPAELMRYDTKSGIFPEASICGTEGNNFAPKEVKGESTIWWKFWSKK